MNKYGNLLIVAAPSGAGKTSLVKALADSIKGVILSISYTTRPPRPADIDGSDYFFTSDATFNQMIKNHDFLEYATVFGHCYGTSIEWVTHKLAQGLDVILEIDWQGMRQVKQQFPQAVGIFILPPSINTLQDRLCDRNQDSSAVVAARMAACTEEISHGHEFDYIVVNDDFDQALEDLKHILYALRLKTQEQLKKLDKLLANWQENE